MARVNRPKVAVIIINWNSGKLLGQCLTALAKQSVIPEKIVVVDNASTDGSADGIEARYSSTKLIHLNQNAGFAEGNNIAIGEVGDSEWIAFLNPDAFPESGWLEKLLESTRSHAGYSFYASRMMLNANRMIVDGVGDVYHTSGAAWRRGHGRKCQVRDLAKVEVFGACAAAALYSRDAFLGVGGFDKRYFCYFEDVDLAFRMRLAGHRCLYVPDAVVYHVGSASTGERSDFTTYHGQRNLVWTYFKNMPQFLFWLYLPQHILLNLAMLVWYSLRGQARVIWKAKWDAVKGLRRVLEERRGIRRTRRVSAWELRRIMAKGFLTPYLRRHV
ncbi:MAG: glycosyltransferase family 2 protein [Planctomycetota bacterium]